MTSSSPTGALLSASLTASPTTTAAQSSPRASRQTEHHTGRSEGGSRNNSSSDLLALAARGVPGSPVRPHDSHHGVNVSGGPCSSSSSDPTRLAHSQPQLQRNVSAACSTSRVGKTASGPVSSRRARASASDLQEQQRPRQLQQRQHQQRLQVRGATLRGETVDEMPSMGSKGARTPRSACPRLANGSHPAPISAGSWDDVAETTATAATRTRRNARPHHHSRGGGHPHSPIKPHLHQDPCRDTHPHLTSARSGLSSSTVATATAPAAALAMPQHRRRVERVRRTHRRQAGRDRKANVDVGESVSLAGSVRGSLGAREDGAEWDREEDDAAARTSGGAVAVAESTNTNTNTLASNPPHSAAATSTAATTPSAGVGSSTAVLPRRPPQTGLSARSRPAVTIVANFPTPSILSPTAATSRVFHHHHHHHHHQHREQQEQQQQQHGPASSSHDTHPTASEKGGGAHMTYKEVALQPPPAAASVGHERLPTRRTPRGGAASSHAGGREGLCIALPAAAARLHHLHQTVITTAVESGKGGEHVQQQPPQPTAAPRAVLSRRGLGARRGVTGSPHTGTCGLNQASGRVPESFAGAGALSHSDYQQYHPTPQFFHESILNRVMGAAAGTGHAQGMRSGGPVTCGYGYSYGYGGESDEEDFFHRGTGSGGWGVGDSPASAGSPVRPPTCCAQCGGAIPVMKLSGSLHHVCLPDLADVDEDSDEGAGPARGAPGVSDDTAITGGRPPSTPVLLAQSESGRFGSPGTPRTCTCAVPVVDRELQAFTAVEVLPGLFLGSYADAANAHALRHYGISLVVNVAQECAVTPAMRAGAGHTRYLHLPLRDHSDESIAPYFTHVSRWVHEQLHRRQVYLHRRRLGRATAAEAEAEVPPATPGSTPRHGEGLHRSGGGGGGGGAGGGTEDPGNPWVVAATDGVPGPRERHRPTTAPAVRLSTALETTSEEARLSQRAAHEGECQHSSSNTSSSGGGEEVVFSGSSRPTSLSPSPVPTRTATFPRAAALPCAGGEVVTRTAPPPPVAKDGLELHEHTTTTTTATEATEAATAEGIVDPRDCGGVLVHCRMGVSRSASFVLAYLILYGGQLAVLDERAVESLFAPDAFLRERLAVHRMGGTSSFRSRAELAEAARAEAQAQATPTTPEDGGGPATPLCARASPRVCVGGGAVDEGKPAASGDDAVQPASRGEAKEKAKEHEKEEKPLGGGPARGAGVAPPLSNSPSASEVTLATGTEGLRTPRERAARSCPACFDMRVRQRRLKALVAATAVRAGGGGGGHARSRSNSNSSGSAEGWPAATRKARRLGGPVVVHSPASPAYHYGRPLLTTATAAAATAVVTKTTTTITSSTACAQVYRASLPRNLESEAAGTGGGCRASPAPLSSVPPAHSNASSEVVSPVSVPMTAALSFREAFDYLKAKKPDVNPNIGFILALRELAAGGDFSLSSSMV